MHQMLKNVNPAFIPLEVKRNYIRTYVSSPLTIILPTKDSSAGMPSGPVIIGLLSRLRALPGPPKVKEALGATPAFNPILW